METYLAISKKATANQASSALIHQLLAVKSYLKMLALTFLPAVVGVGSHVLYFNRGEHHLWGNTYIQIFILSLIAIVTALVNLRNFSFPHAFSTTLTGAATYLLGTFTSLLVYRVWLSPLNKFPGPWQAKISGVWFTSQIENYDTYLRFAALHKKYGRYVRIGPNDLSVSDADLHELAFGQNTRFRKAPWYDNSKPYSSMHTTRDKSLHDRRRRTWAPAFSDKALREYEPKVRAFNEKLVERVREHKGSTIDMRKWFNLYSFDVMGKLAFGKDYNMLDSGERIWALDLLAKGMEAAPPRLPAWIIRILLTIPFATRGFYRFLRFCHDELEWRVNNKSIDGDITGWLLKAYKDIESPADDPLLNADTRLIIVAGSDTTAATLTFLFYELARKPEEVEKLRKELQPLTTGEWGDVDIRNAQHLNGAIDEALRLHPPVPSGLERKVPEGGTNVGDVHIPQGANFWMPQYVIGRGRCSLLEGGPTNMLTRYVDEEFYDNALEFIPERWYSKPEMIKHKNAFAVFSLGSEGCIGKTCKGTFLS